MDITYDLAAAAADEAGIDADDVSPYSGRGMGDRECLSLRFESDRDVHDFVRQLAVGIEANDDLNDPDVQDRIDLLLDGKREDQMGRRAIAYWPSIVLTDVPDHIF